MMKLSIYTFVQNGIEFDFHVVDMLKHHLPLADEIIVNEGFSTDSTYHDISNIDKKIKIFRNKWDISDPSTWSLKFKNTARKKCTGDWCILLDCDEFIPEWEFEKIRNFLQNTNKIIFSMEYLNFYGNFKVFNTNPDKFKWPRIKFTVHRNQDNIEVWGDGSNVKIKDEPFLAPAALYGDPLAVVHHFGFVRDASRLREKWRIQHLRNAYKKWGMKIPSFVYKLFPHKWGDPFFLEDLEIYDGPYCRAVTENPNEFIRDNLELYNLLYKKKQMNKV